MAGFRKDFAALKLAGGEDSSSDDDGGGDLKKKMAARFGGVGKGRAAQGAAHEPEHKGALDALRGQKGAGTWKTSEAAAPESERTAASGVGGFRAGTHVSTAPRGAAAAAVDAAPRTAYGARMAAAPAYVGPASSAKAAAAAPGAYEKPAPLPGAAGLDGLLDELNAFRANPRAYAATVARFRPFYDGLDFHAPRGGAAVPRATIEGVAALDELLGWLKTATPAPAIKLAPGLADAARELVDAAAAGDAAGRSTGSASHATLSNKVGALSPAARAAARGLVEGAVLDVVARRVLFADEALLQLLLADGDATRRTRRHVADARLSRGGGASAATAGAGDGTVAALTLAATFRPHPTPGKRAYRGKVPVSDDDWLQCVLALPDPLPNDLLAMVKRGASVEVDYQTTGANVVATFPGGAVEEISVEFG